MKTVGEATAGKREENRMPTIEETEEGEEGTLRAFMGTEFLIRFQDE